MSKTFSKFLKYCSNFLDTYLNFYFLLFEFLFLEFFKDIINVLALKDIINILALKRKIFYYAAQGQTKGPDPLGDEPPRIFSKDITEEERRELLMKAYENLKSSFQKLIKPDGEKNSPAKTCRDLFIAYPDKLSGKS